eukprot:2004500-Lingulodinium_polyedra.AAC.1
MISRDNHHGCLDRTLARGASATPRALSRITHMHIPHSRAHGARARKGAQAGGRARSKGALQRPCARLQGPPQGRPGAHEGAPP